MTRRRHRRTFEDRRRHRRPRKTFGKWRSDPWYAAAFAQGYVITWEALQAARKS